MRFKGYSFSYLLRVWQFEAFVLYPLTQMADPYGVPCDQPLSLEKLWNYGEGRSLSHGTC